MKKIILLIILCGCVRIHEGTDDAKSFLATFYPEAKSILVQCQTYDTDQNGYVSCTGKVDEKLIAMECPVKNPGCVTNTECRLAKSSVVQIID